MPNANETFLELEPCNGMILVMRPGYSNLTFYYDDQEDCSDVEADFSFDYAANYFQTTGIRWYDWGDMNRWLCGEGECYSGVKTFELGDGNSSIILTDDARFVELYCEDCIDPA